MKITLLVAAVAALLLIPPAGADAGWYMRYGQAKNTAKAHAKELCNDLRECEAWGAGQCQRRASARFDCLIATWFPGVEYAEEIECQQVLHIGVRAGYVAVKSTSKPRCY